MINFARMEGLGIGKPTEECMVAHANSLHVCAPLIRFIKRQEYEFDQNELSQEVKGLRIEVDTEADKRFKSKLESILDHAPTDVKRAVQAASEKGAASWETAVQSYDHGTVLRKSDFMNA